MRVNITQAHFTCLHVRRVWFKACMCIHVVIPLPAYLCVRLGHAAIVKSVFDFKLLWCNSVSKLLLNHKATTIHCTVAWWCCVVISAWRFWLFVYKSGPFQNPSAASNKHSLRLKLSFFFKNSCLYKHMIDVLQQVSTSDSVQTLGETVTEWYKACTWIPTVFMSYYLLWLAWWRADLVDNTYL